MKTILADLERFARLEGMHRLGETLADARFLLPPDKPVPDTEESEPGKTFRT